MIKRLQEGIIAQRNTPEELRTWDLETVDTLKVQCRFRGLASTGKKQLLVDRLSEHSGQYVTILQQPLSATRATAASFRIPEEDVQEDEESLEETADPAVPLDTDGPDAEPELDLSAYK